MAQEVLSSLASLWHHYRYILNAERVVVVNGTGGSGGGGSGGCGRTIT